MAAGKLSAALHKAKSIDGAFSAGVVFFIVVVVGLSFVASAFYDKLMDAQQMPVSTLQITGERLYSTDTEVQQALSELSDNESFFSLNVDKVKLLVEQVPWINHVAVRRQWPNGLSIHVTEQVPAAHWNSSQLVNTYGEIFEAPVSRININLPQFFAPNNVPKDVLEGYRALLPLFESEGLKVEKIELSERESWTIFLEDNTRLIVGRGNKVIRNARLERFLQVYKHAIPNDKSINYVDLRYDSGFAVNWKKQPGEKASNEQG